ESENGVIDVVLQISNFLHRKGGAEDRMFFGTANNILQYKQRIVITNAFLLGILVILSIYHFILFVYRNEISTGIFSLLCLIIALRLLSTSEKLIFEIFPNINWLLTIKVEYLSYKIALPLLVGFIHSLYPAYFRRGLIRLLFILAAIFSFIVLFTPVQFFSYTPLIYQFILAFGAVYAVVALIRASIKNEENAVIVLAGYLVFFGLLTNDMLYYNRIINTSFLMHYGLFILALSQSIVLSRKFSTSYQKVEALSNELEKHNQMLEYTVLERTRKIQEQKEEIEQQSESLKYQNEQLKTLTDFKENLTQMIVHDLKTPLSVVLNVSNNKQVKYAGTQMLNLVQNMLDVQRYENSKMDLKTENTPISQLFDNAIYQLQHLIRLKSININININNEHYTIVDKDIITRVFVNLLSNSVRFTPYKGKISISTSEEESHIIFKISDNGPGIPEDQKELIFKKFGQYISNVGSQKGTTGIGLTFCKLALEAHGGSIHYKTSEEDGTTFYCSLPKGNATDTNASRTKNKNHFTGNNFSFTENEKTILKEVVSNLNNLHIYQIGEIKQQLNCINSKKNSQIEAWVKEIKNAVFNSDEQQFKKLLSETE
nr:sensor histidine kinase [Prolixibacteraceae bacterium]